MSFVWLGSLLLLYLQRQIGGELVVSVLYFVATLYGALFLFYYNVISLIYTYWSALNSALILHFVLLVFLLKGLCKKLVLVCL